MSKAAACREYGLSRTALEALIRAGMVKTVAVPGQLRVRVVRKGLDDWLAGGNPSPPKASRVAIMPREL